ncbi:MAG: 50S ribosomal protein L24 [Planctomycetes bacterium]|nr:50S ribosomal protein L24 [Planctomycetota bacterium]
MQVKVGDIVQIIKGKDRPQTEDERAKPSGRVLRVDRETNRVIVEGKNMVWKHLRKTEQNPQGGRQQREAAIPAANVMLWNEQAGKPERVHYKKEGGKKVRYFKSTKTVIDG